MLQGLLIIFLIPSLLIMKQTEAKILIMPLDIFMYDFICDIL
jgi:hypothetical protein